MKRLPIAIFVTSVLAVLGWACSDSNTTWDDYTEWQKENVDWYNTQKALRNSEGDLFYTQIQPKWYPQSGVLIHYFNDRRATEGNLQPMLSSTVSVKYRGELYNGTPFDSSYLETDSLRTFTINDGLIAGWQIALTHMRVGDSCRVVIPYAQGYGVNGNTSIPPFSTLSFDIKLVDIPDYEIRN